jgi:hypothetical protein
MRHNIPWGAQGVELCYKGTYSGPCDPVPEVLFPSLVRLGENQMRNLRDLKAGIEGPFLVTQVLDQYGGYE